MKFPVPLILSDSVQSQSTATTTSFTTSSAESQISSLITTETGEDTITVTHGATTAAPLPTIQSTSAPLIAESTNYIWIVGVLTGSILTVILIALIFVTLCKKCRQTSAQARITNTRDHGSEPPTQGFSNPDYSYADLRGNGSDPTRSVIECVNPDRDYPPNQQVATEVQYENTNPHESNNRVPQKPKTSNVEEEYSIAGAAADDRNKSQQEDAAHVLVSFAQETAVLDLEQRTDSNYDELRYASKEWGTVVDARQQVYSDVEEIDHLDQPQQSESSYDKLCHPKSGHERFASREPQCQSQMDHGKDPTAHEDQPQESDPSYGNVQEKVGGNESSAIADIPQQDYDEVDRV
ncbi:uncharacterized protein LOC135812524 [Sycon ciliatum]|uniref:uncharacterized protein LOC135812524 n=1 Tax=Sycon ciliatum TaxID=27933 RepID=UPI0031F708C4